MARAEDAVVENTDDDQRNVEAPAAHPQFSDTLFSRPALLLATLAILLLLTVVVYTFGMVADGGGLLIGLFLLIMCLFVGGFIRYRCRIGLRSFLVAVTVVSVVFAVIAQFMIRVRTVHQGVEELRKGGATITYALESSNEWTQTESGFPVPPWMLNTFGSAAFSNVTHANFMQSAIDRERVEKLFRICPKVEHLNFDQAKIELNALDGLGEELKELRFLELSSTNLTDEDFADAVRGAMSLEWVYLRFAPIGAAGLKELRGLPKLRTLWIEGATVNDEAIRALGPKPNMQVILARAAMLPRGTMSGITDAGVEAIVEQMPNVDNLDVSRNWSVTSQSAKAILKLRRVKYLNVSSTSFSDEGLRTLGRTTAMYIDVRTTDVTLKGVEAFQALNPECRVAHNAKPPPVVIEAP